MHKHDIKIAAIQETKLDANCKLPTFHNYTIIRKDRSNTGGGLALLVHSSVRFRELDIRNHLGDTTTECQGISTDTANGPLNIYNIYIPPRSSCPNGFIPSISHLLLNEDSLILGDLNAHDDLWNSSINDERGQAIADEISNSEFGVINENLSTRVPSNGQSTSPDVSIVSASLLTFCTWTTYTDLSSDHLPIVIDILLADEGIFTDRKTYYNLAKADWPKFTEFCEQKFNTALTPELDNLSAQKMDKTFRAIINEATTKFIPARRRKLYKPGLNKQVTKLISERSRLRETNPTSNRIGELNSAIMREIDESKRKDWHKFVESFNHRYKPRQLWRVIKSLSGRAQPSSNSAIIFNGQPIADLDVIADGLNKLLTRT